MALETPSRHTASINMFFALEDQLPPALSNAEIVQVTANEGCTLHLFPVEGDFTGSIADGFFLELQHPVNSAHAAWFSSGPPGTSIQYSVTPNRQGVTPLPQQPDTNSPIVNGWAASNGNFLCIDPDFGGETYGWCGISIYEIPRVDDAETPIPLPPPPAEPD